MDTYGVGPLRLEIIEPMQVVRLVLESNDSGLACDILCHTTALPYEDPIVVTRVDGRLLTERAVYEVLGEIEGWVEVAGERYQLSRATTSLFRNHSWGYQGGRGGPRLYGAPSRHRARPAGLRNWVLFHMPDHGGFYQTFDNTEGRRTISEGAMLFADRSVPVTDVDVTNEFYNGDSLRLKSARFTLTDAEGGKRAYEAEDLGWVYCQGGGYFGGFNDGLGQGVYRGDYHVEGEVWDVSHPTLVVDESGKSFEFPDAWAENFTRLRSGSQTGLAHFEAVVFRPKEH
jgi:hypothetical protein